MSGVDSLEEACLDMNGIERNESDATTSEKLVPTCAERGALLSPAAQKKLSFLERHAVKNSSRYLVANNALVADTQVDEALVAFCSEKYRLGYSTSTDSKSMGNTEGTSCHACPPELEASHSRQEQRSSRVVRAYGRHLF